MSERQKETAFLKRIILLGDTNEGRELERKIAKVECDERRVRRFAAGMALCGALAVAGLAYGAILQEDVPFGTPESVVKVLYQLALASLICLMGFAAQLAICRQKLNRFQEECRQLIIRLWAVHAGEPRIGTMRASHPGAGVSEGAQGTVEINGSHDGLGSLREEMVDCMNKTSPERDSFA